MIFSRHEAAGPASSPRAERLPVTDPVDPATEPRTPRTGRRRATTRRQARKARRAAPVAPVAAAPAAPAVPQTRQPEHRPPGHRARRRAWRRAAGLPGTLAVTFLGALVPGGGFLWTGRRLLGVLVLLPTLALAGFSAWYAARDLDAALDLVLDPTRLKVAAGVIVGALAVWAVIVYLTYRQVRPLQRQGQQPYPNGQHHLGDPQGNRQKARRNIVVL